MDKEKEIKMLNYLRKDSYFAQYFGSSINQMIENIKNDFPIEYCCPFMEDWNKERISLKTRNDALAREMADMKQAFEQQMEEVAKNTVEGTKDLAIKIASRMNVSGDWDSEIVNTLKVMCGGEREYFRMKIDNDFEITVEDLKVMRVLI